MKYLFAAVLALGTVASFSAAEAAGGCGPGWHRGPYGGCQPNRRAVVVRAPSSWRRLRSSWCGPVAAALTAPCGAMDAAALIDISKARQKPRSRGAFFIPCSSNLLASDLPVATTTPVAAAPATAAMPAPMPATPTAAAPVPATPAPAPSAPAAMTAAAPAHFFRREAIDLLARRDGGLGIRIDGQFGVVGERRRHQRRGLRARCKRDAAGGKSKGEFQKVAAFHHISSSVCWVRRREFRCAEMNAR